MNRSHSPLKITALFLGLSLVVVCVILFVTLLTPSASEDALIRIPRGATSQMVEDSIARYLGHGYAAKVMKIDAFARTSWSGRHGAYLIPKGMSPLKAHHRLSRGAQHPVKVTILGSRGLSQLSERIASRLDFSPEEFSKAATDSAFLAGLGLTPDEALALFIDDTYEAYWSSSPDDLLRKIAANYKKVWNEERRKKAADLGLSPSQVDIVCSIVDEETNKLDEKDEIGRLYINRFRKGMKLQADPTVKFALGDFSIRRVLSNHLKVDSPYNTYRYNGLPPGPIRTVSVATIDAVLDSSPHDYLYMCAKEDFSGRHNFAATYQEHIANARRYQQALDSRGIR